MGGNWFNSHSIFEYIWKLIFNVIPFSIEEFIPSCKVGFTWASFPWLHAVNRNLANHGCAFGPQWHAYAVPQFTREFKNCGSLSKFMNEVNHRYSIAACAALLSTLWNYFWKSFISEPSNMVKYIHSQLDDANGAPYGLRYIGKISNWMHAVSQHAILYSCKSVNIN